MIIRRAAIGLAALGFGLLGAAPWAAPAEQPHRVRVLRSWDDVVKAGDTRLPRRIEVVFDYTTGIARRVTRDASGAVLSVRVIAGTAPQPTPEEIAEASQMVRADPELGRVVARTGAVVDGGFLLREPAGSPCGPRSRCVQVLLFSENRLGTVRRVVVDLVRGVVVYPAYSPAWSEKAPK